VPAVRHQRRGLELTRSLYHETSSSFNEFSTRAVPTSLIDVRRTRVRNFLFVDRLAPGHLKTLGAMAPWTGIESKGTGNNSRAEPRRSGVGSPTMTST